MHRRPASSPGSPAWCTSTRGRCCSGCSPHSVCSRARWPVSTCAVPALELLPADSDQRQFLTALGEQYPAQEAPTAQVVVDGTDEQLAGLVEDIDAVGEVEQRRPRRTSTTRWSRGCRWWPPWCV